MKAISLKRSKTAILISIFVFVLLVATAPNIGLTWDEPAYIAASESYMDWYGQVFTDITEAFSEEGITDAWMVNNEHPPLDKIWSGAVWTVARNFTSDLTAHRMGNMILVALLAGLLYLLIRDAYGQLAGLAAIVALLTMPRFFFHAHLSALDVPAAVSVFIVTFVFWKTLERKKWTWGLLLGLIWGLALATKINAVFVPVTLGLWCLIFRREVRLFVRLFIMGITAIPVFIAVWPWLYVDTFERLTAYIHFVTDEHWEIGQYYLGQFFMPPPWHFGFVMLWAVLPLGLTIIYLIGIVCAGNGKRDNGLSWLLFLSALTPILAIATGKSMVYDNERLIMVSFPFLAGLAGVGFGWIVSSWENLSLQWNRPILSRVGLVILALLAFAPQLVTTTKLYPHLLSYYGESVDGLSGATRMGLETTYWCESYNIALSIINEQANPKDRIWVDPWSHDVLIYYQTQGLLRDDVLILAPFPTASILGLDAPSPLSMPMESADWYIFQHRQSMLGFDGENNSILKTLNQKEVVYEYSFDGVPVMTLYK
ncbi:MAG: glycosyltransferase family 39 protein [Anaerolineales bacterium]|nr:glycosyltransferase family 39 protein [Anaerolineales bacterium]